MWHLGLVAYIDSVQSSSDFGICKDIELCSLWLRFQAMKTTMELIIRIRGVGSQ